MIHLDFRGLAFYDVLEINNSVVAMGDEILRIKSRELRESMMRNSMTIDWTIKASVQVPLRRNIRRKLRIYGCHRDKQEE